MFAAMLRLAVIGLMILGGCVVLPTTEPAPESGAPLVHISKKDVDPPLLDTPAILKKDVPTHIFEVTGAVQQLNVTGLLRYYWYYDLKHQTGIPLEFYRACSPTQRCILTPCTLPKPTKSDHRLLLVVSDGDLVENAKDPYHFPAGTAFDSVEWQIQLVNECVEF